MFRDGANVVSSRKTLIPLLREVAMNFNLKAGAKIIS
jgi:hypothetical protein